MIHVRPYERTLRPERFPALPSGTYRYYDGSSVAEWYPDRPRMSTPDPGAEPEPEEPTAVPDVDDDREHGNDGDDAENPGRSDGRSGDEGC